MEASTMCAGVGKSGSPRMSEISDFPCACKVRISARIAFTAVGRRAEIRFDPETTGTGASTALS
jgi:hypothetical protein